MSVLITFLSIVLFISVPIGNIGTSFAASLLPEPRPLGNEIRAVQPSDLDLSSDTLSRGESPSAVLTLNEALRFALMNNPKLAAFSWEVRARDADVLQAGLLLNPELSFEVENLAGSGALRGTEQAEATLSLGQRIETAGKRRKREKVAAFKRMLAGWDYETLRLDLLTEVSRTFIEVLGDQKKVSLSEELLKLAAQVAETVEKRVDAGKVSPVEAVKVNVSLSLAKIDLGRAERELTASRKALAAMWGNTDPAFKTVEGQLSPASFLPSFDQLADRLAQNPELARWEAELSQRQVVIDLEEARAIPDITFGGGFRQFNDTDDSALTAWISIDLPVFNRNQGAVQEARAQRSKALAARRAEVLRLRTALAQAYRLLSTAYSEVEGLKNDLLPGAEKAFEAVSEGYRLGKFDLLDVLDAQRTLSHARVQHLQAQIDYHKALADVEGLIGEKIESGEAGKPPLHEGD